MCLFTLRDVLLHLLVYRVDKLFGHSSELLTLAASPSSPLFASACHASTAKHASIRIWDATIWRPVGKPLEWHGLSVTRLQFGDVGQGREGLVSVSRDRGWAVWGRGEDGTFGVYLLFQEADAGCRSIRLAARAGSGAYQDHLRRRLESGRIHVRHRVSRQDRSSPLHFAPLFPGRSETDVNAQVKIWSRRGDGWELVSTIKFTVGARAVAFAPLYSDQATSARYAELRYSTFCRTADSKAAPLVRRVLLAVGLEDGKVVFYSSSPDNETAWTDEGQLDPKCALILPPLRMLAHASEQPRSR